MTDSRLGALQRGSTVVALGILPLAAVLGMLLTGSAPTPSRPTSTTSSSPRRSCFSRASARSLTPAADPLAAPNFIWPPLAGYLVAPLTLLPPGAADVVTALLGLAGLALSLWLVGVRDWRVYGVFCLWPEVVGEVRVAHLTPVLRSGQRSRGARGGRTAPGLAIGLATSVKFLMWPLVVWLAATRRTRDALVAAAVVCASLLLVLPYTGLDAYLRSLLRLGRAFDQDSYTVFGMLVQAGAPESAARAAMLLVGGALLVATWRYRSFTLAIAAALALSPIVWLDYFALAAVPLGIYRSRLAWVWFAPLATWGLEGAGLGIGDFWHSARLLGIFAIVLGVALRGRAGRRGGGARAAGARDSPR